MEALIAIQSELKAPKNQHNSFGGYNYRSCEDILEAVKPLLTKHKCTLTISDDMVEMGLRVYVRANAVLTYEGSKTETISVTAFAREAENKKGMDAAQVTGAASSYARKYALNGLFLIDDMKDADTQDNRQEAAPPQRQAPPVDDRRPEPGSWAEEELAQQAPPRRDPPIGGLIQEAPDSWVEQSWNGKIYGHGDERSIYVNNEKTVLAPESVVQLQNHPKYKPQPPQ